ncbi:hypothetical protein [Variovorax sp. UMC13]|uniref:hypothetical protein n=1 Tax=Variovorax sp. UMC13 TaxID=1862326 RepID=UPI0015FFB196|nr:hypothetical protein [Variovorax sp. UMC13]MBB1602912.1 hypothetical protein [Variovorax sp. UMC13]
MSHMGLCKLCGNTADLQLSHIIPAFVFKWQRASSGNRHLRSSDEPNARVQDGIKKHWLCSDCEELFSRSERAFATHVFHPYVDRSGGRFSYGPWMLHFCVSVSWRLIKLALEEATFDGWTEDEMSSVKRAEVTWREFLLGQRAHPGEFRQHLLPTDEFSSQIPGMVPNFNRYMMRAIQMDLARGSKSTFTFAKLGRFMLIGSIREVSSDWSGTKVNANEGVVAPRKYMVPGSMFGYWNHKAQAMADALGSVSPRQKQKIEDAFRANIERFSESDAFRAMQADVEMFGESAFSPSTPLPPVA